MSLDYTTLQSTVLGIASRAELTTEVVQFIRSCESMIRREVEALPTRKTLVEADRSSSGVYNLSGQVLDVLAAHAVDSSGEEYPLENVGIAGIRLLPSTADVQHYAVLGQTIEFRGVPATDSSLPIIYMGWPDALATTATNDLLTNYEDLYIYGTLFHLYKYEEALELANDAKATFDGIADTLNILAAKLQGGGSIMPAYNFGQVQIGKGY